MIRSSLLSRHLYFFMGNKGWITLARKNIFKIFLFLKCFDKVSRVQTNPKCQSLPDHTTAFSRYRQRRAAGHPLCRRNPSETENRYIQRLGSEPLAFLYHFSFTGHDGTGRTGHRKRHFRASRRIGRDCQTIPSLPAVRSAEGSS